VARYDIYDAQGTLLRAGVCVDEAARVLGAIPEEVEWCIEEFGLCDNDQHVIVGARDPFPH
jgi:hypothetical protein